MLRDADNDSERMGLYPNLDYKSLFNALSGLVDSTPHLQYGTLGNCVDYFGLCGGGVVFALSAGSTERVEVMVHRRSLCPPVRFFSMIIMILNIKDISDDQGLILNTN